MDIKIDKDYKIKSDERNIILVKVQKQKDGKNKGQLVESGVGYFGTVQEALKDYLRIRTNTSAATSIKQLLQEIKNAEKTIEEVLQGR